MTSYFPNKPGVVFSVLADKPNVHVSFCKLEYSVTRLQVGPATGLLALAVLKKDQQTSAHERVSSLLNRHPSQPLKPQQYCYEDQTQGSCGALNLSMKTAPTERLIGFKTCSLLSYTPFTQSSWLDELAVC